MTAAESSGWLRRALRCLRTAARHDVLLDGDVLVQRDGHRETRLPLIEVRQVRSDWIPYRGDVLHVTGGGRRITISVHEGTEELRRALGQRVVQNGPSVVESARVRQQLGLTD